ncbi:hypothetical protein A8F94_18915 [Bacillus sp. FJAT-27225]|uniref:immunity 22 family protein n=1 Tax=Bacillus sp. FJAT-27225 TaxID=1743144 RepID=UPI00080C2C9F|nr:immunity 22 family protein [Bacillus sp. FJAT-27225]OCA83188.1 hypothetical protein A8F94_18915 [Bacillus sp. FJAT-27225]
MEREGYVSLWVGGFESKRDLDEYLKIEFTEDGDALPSRLGEDFFIDYYDEDFREAKFFEKPPESLEEALNGFSYDEVIVPAFEGKYKGFLNTAVLLYNFYYEERAEGKKSPLLFVGTIRYK